MNDLAINVFSSESNNIFPLYISKQKLSEDRIIDLFFIKNDEKSHYWWIKNLVV
jgi:hypothetical protein